MALFNTNWKTQIVNIIPPEIRGQSFIDFIDSLLVAIQTNMDTMFAFETDIMKRAKINAQKMVLQAALNDIFGVVIAPFIIIETALPGAAENVYTINEGEGAPTVLYSYNESEFTSDPIFLFNEAEAVSAFDFVVKIPVGIWTAELERQVKSEVNLYKLAGTKFNIITY